MHFEAQCTILSCIADHSRLGLETVLVEAAKRVVHNTLEETAQIREHRPGMFVVKVEFHPDKEDNDAFKDSTLVR
jgi:hypothetical protein